MIQTTTTHHCSKCGSSNIMLNGHNRYGKQQYLCKACRCCRVLAPTARGYSEEDKERALRVYQERASLRGTERALGISRQTIAGWIKKSPITAPDSSERRRRAGR